MTNTSWTARTESTSTWSTLRLGGAYLTNTAGEYIVTANSEKIIVIIPGGSLPISSWNDRTAPNTTWAIRATI